MEALGVYLRLAWTVIFGGFVGCERDLSNKSKHVIVSLFQQHSELASANVPFGRTGSGRAVSAVG